MPNTLYVIATPIGNLEDISKRAKRILGKVDTVLCEDTRVTGKLLHALDIDAAMLSYHQHSGMGKEKKIGDRVEDGEVFALVSDAGTPTISDPGSGLIAYLTDRFADLQIIPVPGPSAVIAALSVSGFSANSFRFLGFPPHKKGRNAFFDTLSETSGTVVVYESKHRIEKTLAQCRERIGDRPVVLCRELTKKYETIYRGTCNEVTEALKSDSIKGEFVLVIGPNT